MVTSGDSARPPAMPAAVAASLTALKPLVAVSVVLTALLSLLELALAFVARSMPASHFVAVPIAIGVIVVAWFVELAGLRWPRLVFAIVVTAPNLWLAAIGHNGLNFLFLLLTVAWVGYAGSPAESGASLALSLLVVGVGALVAVASGQLFIGAWVPWVLGLVMMWWMTHALVSQQRLAAELHATQRDLMERAGENERLRAAAEARLRDVEALYRADASLYGALRTEQVLRALVDVVADAVVADQSAVLTWDMAGERLVTAASDGDATGTLAHLCVAAPYGAVGHVLQSRHPLALADITTAAEPDASLPAAVAAGVRALLVVPILLAEEVFGVLLVGYRRPRRFTEEEERLFVALAQRTSLALENARLYEQARQTALLEERQRLARELHDAVTQTLFASSLIADVLPRLWARDPTEGQRRLDELRELTRGALAEMRTLLYELRPAALTETPLGDLLRQLVEATIGHARLPVSLTVAGQRPLPPDVQVAFYRIAQEALNNVAKHARASRADVSVVYQDGTVELRVRDDGHGFAPSDAPPGHLGIGIMRERAVAVGADLEIMSEIGQGTSVTVTWAANGRGEEDD